MKKITILLLALMLSFTLLFTVSCNNNENGNKETPNNSQSTEQGGNDKGELPAEGLWKDATYRNNTELGTGEKSFTFTVTIDGKSVDFAIKTNQTTVGQALLELGLIEGEAGAYGLYVKKVNGVVADYDIDKTYWAFYINGEYAMSGVDTTNIVNGATYKFVREK